MKKIVIVFDRDGVLNTLNEKVAETVGVLFSVFNKYKHDENELLTDEIRRAIYKCYSNPQIFADVSPAEGYKEVARLRKYKEAFLVVNSLSASDIIADVKKKWDAKHGIDFFDAYLDQIGDTKDMQEACIQIEDCLENVYRSKANYKILINKPYNQGELPENTFRVESLPEATEVIEELILKMRKERLA